MAHVQFRKFSPDLSKTQNSPKYLPPAKSSDGFPRQLPVNVRNAAMAFNDSSHYGLHDVYEWESLIPRGNGWVVLGPGPRSYAVTMYHQLHCLNAMRYDLTQSKIGKAPTQAELGHAHHCYNYIRQGLQCGLDLTLDLSHDGLGNTAHVCRDWAQIRTFMERNYDQHTIYFSWCLYILFKVMKCLISSWLCIALISAMPPSLITNHQLSVRPIKQTPTVERHPTPASPKARWRTRVAVHTRGKVGSIKCNPSVPI